MHTLIYFDFRAPSNSEYSGLKTTEIIDAQYKTHTYGPELPFEIWHHCVVSISSKVAMLIGGNTGDPVNPEELSTTFFFDFDTSKWTQGPVF